MTLDPTSATRDDVHAEVRRAIDALVQLGDLGTLHPIDLVRVGAAASEFADIVTSATRRSNGTARGKRGTRRGRGTGTGTDNSGDAA